MAIVIQHNHNIFLHKCKGENGCLRVFCKMKIAKGREMCYHRGIRKKGG
jgi:hypothetical protein